MNLLIIAEKPKVSQKIAGSISNNYKKIGAGGASFYEVQKNGTTINVAAAAGHLFSLTPKESGWKYPIFDIEWTPIYAKDKSKAYIKKYITLLSKLGKEADEFVIATDWDIEGELLGYNALRFASAPKIESGKDKRKFHRMRFSTLTSKDLKDAFENLSEVDIKLVDAGEARHKMDWYWGINTSRALTQSVKKARGRFATISAGRVQTPALATLVIREKEIGAFTPETYWEIFAHLDAKGENVKAEHKDGKIFEKDRMEQIRGNSKSDKALVEKVEKNETKKLPPFPFDLSTLQTEAYRLFKYNPKKTQQIAQTLYEGGLISYPRTSSQKLPPAIGYKKILESLAGSNKFGQSAGIVLKKSRLSPRQGKKDDPAHPAIYPTGNLPKGLEKEQNNIYSLIAFRFIALFGDPMVRETIIVEIRIEKEPFRFSGSRTLEEGWGALYPYFKPKEVVLPEINQNDILKVLKVYPEEKETAPPPRFNPSSLLKELEKRGLGTKATRADIIDTLYTREYISGNPIVVTPLGTSVIEALEENAPDIISEKLTREFEEKLENIRAGKISKEDVLKQGREKLLKILDEFKEKEKEIGMKLTNALIEKEKEKSEIGACPTCKEGTLVTKKGKFGNFIACNRYPDCKATFKLPPKGLIKPTDKSCPECSHPIITVIHKGKKPLDLCINTNCPLKTKKTDSKPEITDENCPKCEKGKMIKRRSIYGEFYGCSNYPKCKFTRKI